ncbi:MAG: hypothetical protein A2Y94_11820 [Caldithrix sp. RBG_13_44_9]|nr:MAG: hypothetical protein A2Y94_11820 [Caldithrix sp. RBG_13_44_9]
MTVKISKLKELLYLQIPLLLLVLISLGIPQGETEKIHKRGRLWEVVANDGWIGTLGAWDFLVSYPEGMFPGFKNYFHPVGGESQAENTFANANMHNFRSGCWVVAKDILTPGPPPYNTATPTDYETFLSGLQEDSYGVESVRPPMTFTMNYIEEQNFNPLLPEEMTEATWNTSTSVTVKRRSYVWSYPGYRDFIIYDYTFKNSGIMVSTFTNTVAEDFPTQNLENLYIVFHSGISVSTKSQINFHSDLNGVQAGAFGWKIETFHDYYHIEDNSTLLYSTNYNGGKEPPPWDIYPMKDNEEWKLHFGDELQSPAAFGWLALYASPTGSSPRISPKPDVLRVDSHKGGTFKGSDLDLEFFRMANNRPKKDFYDFAARPDTQAVLGNNGNRLNFYTLSYGPYTLNLGDSLRFIMAEIAGVMDYHDIIAGNPEGHFPDSSMAAIRRNAAFARQAVQWGIGAEVNGMPLAADVPEPPPSPQVMAANLSFSDESAKVGVSWDKIAENMVILDGTGAVFYDGINDLDGYRIYRSEDFQYDTGTEGTVLRGAAWDLIAQVPKAEFSTFWNEALGKYQYQDSMVSFGKKYGYYVSAYNASPNTWTSANGTVVTGLPELASGDYRRSEEVAATAGPVNSFDIFVAPNPYVFNDPERSFGINDPYKIEFRNLPENCTIRIYTISGDLIKTLHHQPDQYGNLSGTEDWNQKSDSGLLVAPGIYIYHIKSNTAGLDESLTGKFMIIR